MSEYINRALTVQELEVLRQEYEMHDDCDELVARRCRSAVSALPAADVAPVRHGRWIRPHWKNSVSCADCSECGAEAHHAEYRGVQKYYKRCPSCGALMDGKEDEDGQDPIKRSASDH